MAREFVKLNLCGPFGALGAGTTLCDPSLSLLSRPTALLLLLACISTGCGCLIQLPEAFGAFGPTGFCGPTGGAGAAFFGGLCIDADIAGEVF